MTTAPWVRVEHTGGVAQLVLERPPVNQFDDRFVGVLIDAVRELDELGTLVRAVVVRSDVPGIFAAGGDIPWMVEAPIEEQVVFAAACQQACSSVERLPQPTVAAVDGACLGGGLELALSCDIRVVGRSATLGLPEPTIGLIAGAGGTQRLVRAIGQGIARDLLLTGRRVSGTEAGAMGIASRVVDDGTAAAAALRLARRLAAQPPEAVQATKRLAIAASEVSIEDGLARERVAWGGVRRSRATQQALEDFVAARRPPVVDSRVQP